MRKGPSRRGLHAVSIIIFCLLCEKNSAFVIKGPVSSAFNAASTPVSISESQSHIFMNNNGNNEVSHASVNVALLASLSSWFAVSWEALMRPHPNPAVAAELCLRHDVLTFSQALGFTFPVITSAFLALRQNDGENEILHRRLLLGIASMSLWMGSGIFWCKTFSRGFELFSKPTRFANAFVQCLISTWALSSWRKSIQGKPGSWLSRLVRGSVGSMVSLIQGKKDGIPVDDPDQRLSNDSALYTFAAIGLFILAALPQLVGFPTATIPTILGKRFSRAASGYTFLGAVLTYCIRDYSITAEAAQSNVNGDGEKESSEAISILRKGLAAGAINHLFLVVGKIIGIDGGGLILPGNGLWKFYPSMVQASRAATFLMLSTFFTLAFVCTGSMENLEN